VIKKRVKKSSAASVTAKSDKPLAIQNRYDAAGNGRRMRGWMVPSVGPNRAVEGLQNIRNRSSDAVRNDWAGESVIQKWTTTLIGVGITPRFHLMSKPSKERLRETILMWMRKCDADWVLDYYGQQTLATRSLVERGEVFMRERIRPIDYGIAIPIQFQLIEADYVPMWDADTHPLMPTGSRVRSGIELDRRGRKTHYWMYRDHPGDAKGAIDPSQLLRIPADEVAHIYCPKRPGQLRGVPELASVLAGLRSQADYKDAVLERQKLANLFAMIVTKANGSNIDPLTGEVGTGASESDIGLEPGASLRLEQGESATFANPPEAGTTFSDYVRTEQLGTASGSGLPYELFSGDIKDISDRTLRVIIQEFRRFAEQRQHQIIIPQMLNWQMERLARAGQAAGIFTEDEARAIRMAKHYPHGWQHIHPVQDPQGKILEMNSGLRSPQAIISGLGDDPEETVQERKAYLEMLKENGIEAETSKT
jgi:lambda family phage portal protein